MEPIKPIVSLTSWRKRINTCGKTIYSIIKHCKFYEKIVLVLSTDEFPELEACLPDDLKIMLDANLFEILWVKDNLKCYKKILYTLKKYPQNPIVSADDDCLYNCDYVSRLYSSWQKNPSAIHSYRSVISNGIRFQHGPAAIYPPGCFGESGLGCLSEKIKELWHDDVYYGVLAKKLGIPVIHISPETPYKFHDTNDALSRTFTHALTESIVVCKKELGVR